MPQTYTYTSHTLEVIAKATYTIYDIFILSSLLFKFAVILFFIKHFLHKTLNFHTTFMYILFFGFLVDIFAWSLDLLNQLCNKFWYNDDHKCWIYKAINVTFGHYNNSFSSIWTLLLSINRFTAIIWFTKYQRVWKQIFKPSILLLIILPFAIIGYSFIDYKCRFFLETCSKTTDFWIIFGNVSGVCNGTLALTSLIVSIIAAKIYRKKKLAKSLQNMETKLIYQAGITSFICLLHYIAYYLAQFKFKYYQDHPDYKWDVDLVIYDSIKFLAYPGYHFSGYILLFVYSPTLRIQFFDFLHLLWLYEIVKALRGPSNAIAGTASLTQPSFNSNQPL